MRATSIVLATFALVALMGGFASEERTLEATSAAVASTGVVAPCAPTDLEAWIGRAHVALSWTGCPGAQSHEVLRAVDAGALEPLVIVGQNGFVDVDVEPGTGYTYAVLATPGDLSDLVAVRFG